MNGQNERQGRSILIPKATGQRIYELRNERGLSQKELAGKAKVSARLVGNIENTDGKKPFDRKKLMRIADALNYVDLRELTAEIEGLKKGILLGVPAFIHCRKGLLGGACVFLILLIVIYLLGFGRGSVDETKPEPSREITKIRKGREAEDNLTEKQQIKNILKEALIYEIEIYTHPEEVDETKLNDYWVPEEQGGLAIIKVKKAIQNLRAEGWHYGPESKNETFIFNVIHLDPSGKDADVKTRESWYLPMYDSNGKRVKERYPWLGLSTFTYTLTKLNGKWLIQSTDVPYAPH